MSKEADYRLLKKFCLGEGADIFAIADISEVKRDFSISKPVLEGMDFAVCLGLRLSAAVLQEIAIEPTRLYFHHYRTVNDFLDGLALKTCSYIQKKGYAALPVPASQILDWDSQKAHLSHRALGKLCGIGWIGRNNLLVNKIVGSQFRLVTILTSWPLKTDKPVTHGCKECRLCIAACPAQAIKENPADFDHLRCFEKLKEFQKKRMVDQYICGVCVNVCRGKNRN
jgi:epoxyqueuosine reductase